MSKTKTIKKTDKLCLNCSKLFPIWKNHSCFSFLKLIRSLFFQIPDGLSSIQTKTIEKKTISFNTKTSHVKEMIILSSENRLKD
jgi:hypothetical protein